MKQREDGRPDTIPPMDEAHEFFKVPCEKTDASATNWIDWFKSRGVKHSIKSMGDSFMLYTHRSRDNGKGGSVRWCCQPEVK